MTEPDLTGQTAAICTAFMGALPSTVLDQPRRTVEPGRFAAAWGDPTITLRCGVARPATLTSTSLCTEVNGVGWFGEKASGGAIFTTMGRPLYVQVGVPEEYGLEASALVDLAPAVSAHIDLEVPCP